MVMVVHVIVAHPLGVPMVVVVHVGGIDPLLQTWAAVRLVHVIHIKGTAEGEDEERRKPKQKSAAAKNACGDGRGACWGIGARMAITLLPRPAEVAHCDDRPDAQPDGQPTEAAESEAQAESNPTHPRIQAICLSCIDRWLGQQRLAGLC